MLILNEDTLGAVVDKAQNDLDAEVYSGKGDIEEALDDILEINEANQGSYNEFVNLLLVGSAGTGKTSRVKAWARKNGINLFELDAKGLDITDLNGAIVPDKTGTEVKRLATTELDALERPRSVLFLDEYNRAPADIRGTLLTLVNDHEINDPREPSGKRKLENFLFTIAAINPPNANYNTDTLDQAELERFYQLNVMPDKNNLLRYLTDTYTKQMEATDNPKRKTQLEGKLALATKILNDRAFEFDTPEDDEESMMNGTAALSPRSFTKVLELSMGKKDKLLKYWNGQCNPRKKGTIERILADYTDVQDKANDALAGGTESDVFGKREESIWDKIKGNLN